jgi:hypothetical protein
MHPRSGLILLLLATFSIIAPGCAQLDADRHTNDVRSNPANLSDEEIIQAILENETLSLYKNWSFKIRWRNFENRKLDVGLYVYLGDWERVNELRVWFDGGEIIDCRIYPYVKTCEPFGIEEEEKRKTIEFAFKDPEVKKTLEERVRDLEGDEVSEQ